MLGRRHPLPIYRRVREFVWPSGGWRRASLYIAHRLRRLPGTPYRIAAGFACGAAISFTPFIGFHFVGAALLSTLLRGSLLASAIGTVVGNPWTFPFIWTWIYALGQWLLGGEVVSELPAVLSLTYIFDRPLDVLWPMTVGGVPTSVAAWFAFFWPVRGAVAEYQHARRRLVRRKKRSPRQRRLGRKRAAALAENESEGS
ncbi:MAG: DUF2062 domain-containing protein [Proteobacteria bacterium]|nr:DUF2062 domain-containing protein [Pseudomonadota bacterium]